MKVRSVTVRAHGHPVLRGTHAKTFELTAEAEVGPRATCVLGVGAAIPAELVLLRGEVQLRLTVDGHSVTGFATVNPSHDISERLVIRRSETIDSDTLAVRSSLTAADLPAEITQALQSADASVTLTLTETSPPSPLIIMRPDGLVPSGRLGALLRGAEEVAPSRPPPTWSGRVFTADLDAARGWSGPAAQAWLELAARQRARFAVAGSSPDATAALLAAGLPAMPALWLGRLDRQALRDRSTRLALAESPVPATATVTRALAAEVLEVVATTDPGRRVAVPDGVLDVGMCMRWQDARAAAASPAAAVPAGSEEVSLVIAPAVDSGSVPVAALLRALEGAGIPARTVADALRPLGWDRREIYRRRSAGARTETAERA